MKIRLRVMKYVFGGKMESHFELACAWVSLLIILATILFTGWLVKVNWSLIAKYF